MSYTIKNAQRGFTLIEAAVVMGIIGAVLGGTMTMAPPIIKKIQIEKTDAKMKKIARSLSNYVVRTNRLPCPADPAAAADPFGAEWNANASGYGTCSGNTNVEGVVPFRALGLSEEDARDGWGRYFTYRVSPAFAINPNNVPTDYNDVHEQCRSDEWIGIENPFPSGDSYQANDEDLKDDDGNYTKLNLAKKLDNNIIFDLEVGREGAAGLDGHSDDDDPLKDKQKLAWLNHHGQQGIGISGRRISDGIHESKIFEQTAYLNFFDGTNFDPGDADIEAMQVNEIELVMDDVKNNINENKSIVYQVFYEDEDGNEDYFWHELQLVMDDSTDYNILSPDVNDLNGKPIYREKLTSLNYSMDGYLQVDIKAGRFKKADGTALVQFGKLKGLTIHTDGDVANDFGFVCDNSYNSGCSDFRPSSVAIWQIKANNDSSNTIERNLNPAKARFCCPFRSASNINYNIDTDIIVQDVNGARLVSERNKDTGETDIYDDLNGLSDNDPLDNANQAVAYALISHGFNGEGSYLGNNTANRFSTGAGNIGSLETENSNNDRLVIIQETGKQLGTNHFDDIVLWRTQYQIYSENGAESCFKP